MVERIEKIEGMNDDASVTKWLFVNAAIEAWNQKGWKLSDEFAKTILENSYMGCVDCGVSDCIYPENGVPYEEALVELRDAVKYEIEKCLENGTDACATKKYCIEKGFTLV